MANTGSNGIKSLSYYEDESDFRIIVDKFIMRREKRDEFNSYLHERLQIFAKRKASK